VTRPALLPRTESPETTTLPPPTASTVRSPLLGRPGSSAREGSDKPAMSCADQSGWAFELWPAS
jgi:hypothetical protein